MNPDSGGDPRRSPRDRSPNRYNDPRDGGQFGGPPRGMENSYRPGPDNRASSNFPPRENYRETGRDLMRDFPSREPPRGPKALSDNIPSGPRANSFSGDFRGRGRGRGRGWRDDSRDRGPRDLDRDFRDRRDDRGPPQSFRDERGHDRDWEDRDRLDRDRRDNFRGGRVLKIRASSPRGRPRSPLRNDSREIMRGRGRGRDDWEPRGGRGRGIYFDARGEPRGRRSRSPERDRPRQDRPPESWDKPYVPRPGSSIALSQTRENPSPPPQAPEVPAFGSVVSNSSGGQPTSAPVAIPTGPRSERPPRSYGGRQEYAGSIQWTNPRFLAAPAKSDVATISPVERKPQETPKPRSPERIARTDVSKDAAEKRESTKTVDNDTNMMEAGEVDESPKVDETVTLIRRPPSGYVPPDDEASDSDIDDDYFEDEIAKVKSQLGHGMAANTLEIFTSISMPFNEETQLRSPIPPPAPPTPPPAPPAALPEPVSKAKEVAPVTTAETPTSMVLDHVPTVDVEMAVSTIASPIVAPKKSPELATPSAELETLALDSKPQAVLEDESGEESIVEEQALEAVRKRMTTPPISSLPFAVITPWNLDTDFMKGIEPNPDVLEFLVASLNRKADIRDKEIEENSQTYKQKYKEWILFHRSDDPLAVRCRERWEANRVAEVSRAASAAPTSENRTEGRRAASRFATDHDIERLLRLSEIEAREQRERSDRAAKKKAASEKEADIPDMLSIEEREASRYRDYTNLVAPDRALAMFEVLPPIADFTEWERDTFEKAMLEFPKQWGKIAEALPGRNYKHCIQYYYLIKHELKLKEKLKKQVKSKGRKRKQPKTSVHTVALGRDEAEEEPTEGPGERRRPKRAAAPTFAFENAPSESDTTTPAPTPGRRGAGTQKEANGETTTGKRKGKTAASREKATKQSKNSQLLAAAPNNAAPKIREETKVPLPMPIIKEWQQPNAPTPEPARFSNHIAPWDGPTLIAPPYTTPSIVLDKQAAPITTSHDIAPQSYSSQERLGSMPPGAVYDPLQQNQRNTAAPTSSYWSVPEQTDFPMLLEHFGTDWHGIAKWMASKTHIMVYTTVFQDWLIVPSDSNKSRRVANLQQQVKNYYQRQIDSGRSDLEEMARIADDKRSRGESTGPPPTPTNHPIKRKYDGPAGSPQRPLGLGSMPDDMEEMYPGGQLPLQPAAGMRFSGVMPTGRYDSFAGSLGRASVGSFEPEEKPHAMTGQHVPSPQPGGARYPPLAQAGAMPPTSHPPSRAAPATSKHMPQAQQLMQQMQQQRPPRGPQLGYFNNDTSRPILRASTSNPSPQPLPLSDSGRTTQRSHMVAQEAQAERQQALRLEEEQRQQARQQQLRLKQETDMQSVNQFEQYPPQHPINPQRNTLGPSRNEPISPIRAEENRRANIASQYQPRNFQQPRNPMSDVNVSTGPSTPVSLTPSALSRSTMGVPLVHQQQAPPPPPQSQAVAAVRQQEAVRKTSSIMSLLNEEPSEPVAPNRAAELQPAAAKPSPSPAPQQPLYQQPPRQVSTQPTHIRRESSLGDIRGSMASQPSRATTIPQGAAVRHGDVSYPVTNAGQTQPQSRQLPGSPLDPNISEREYYAHQQYLMQQQHQQTAVSSPQVSMPYQTQQTQQPQHQSHRQMAFGSSSHHPASPSLSYNQASLHRSRHGSFDGRQQQGLPPSGTQAAQQPGYSTSQHQGAPMSTPYQQPAQQHPLQPSRFVSQQPQVSQPRASPLGQQMSAQSQQMPTQPTQHTYSQLPQHHAQHSSPAPVPQRSYTPVSYDPHPRGYAPPPPQQQQQQPQGMERLNPQQQQQRQQEEEAMIRRQMMQRDSYGPGPGMDRRAEEYQRDLEDRRQLEERRQMDERRQMEERRHLDEREFRR